MAMETAYIFNYRVSVYETSGTDFGYPDDFGDCVVTEIDEQIRSIVFSNGITEVRNCVQVPTGEKLFRTQINEKGKSNLIIDEDC